MITRSSVVADKPNMHFCNIQRHVWSRKKTPCVTTSNLIIIGQTWPPLWDRPWMTPRITPLRIRVTMPNLTAVGPTVRAYVWRYAGKNWAPRVPPFKVTQGHRNWHG